MHDFHEVAHRRGSIAPIQALYQIEAEITGRSAADRHAERQVRSKPLLDDLHTWMQAQRRRASSKTALGKALQYALGRWEALARYADDGKLAIDNNLAERLLRGIAVTRKNFLFLGSDKGGERAAILYTLIETAKLNGLNPEAYLPHAIDQAGARPSRLQAQRTPALELQGRHQHHLNSLCDVNRGDRLTLTLEVPRPRNVGADAGASSEPVHLLVDSKALKLCGKGEWLLEKHGTATRRSWRMLHLGVDAGSGQIVASTLSSRPVNAGSPALPVLSLRF